MLLNVFLIAISLAILFVGIWNIRLRAVSTANVYLGLFVACFAFSIIYILAVNNLSATNFNLVLLLPLNVIMLPILLVLYYVNKFLNYHFFHKNLIKFCFVLALLEICSYLLPVGAWLYTEKLNADLISFSFSIKRFFMFTAFFTGTFALADGLRKIRTHQTATQLDKADLRWIRQFFYLVGFLLLVVLIPEVAYLLKRKSFGWYILQSTLGGLLVAMIGWKNGRLNRDRRGIEALPEASSVDTTNHFKKINQLFIEEKIYRNSELRISDVADRIYLSANYVSKIINENAQVTFNDFVNEYRIREVVEKFEKNEHLQKNIIAIANEAGFHSKSTFQTAFKKKTGKTPTQFIKDQLRH